MIQAVAARHVVVGHLRAAIGAALLVLAGSFFLYRDRSPPFEYVSTDITPRPAQEGGVAHVTRHVIWHRHCDGEIYREIVKPSGQIALYDRAYRPFPSHLGSQSATSTFELPTLILSPNAERGKAVYRGRVRFRECGLTSRLWPIEIEFQEVEFDVVRRQ